MKEFTVYRILRDGEMSMGSFDQHDAVLKDELFNLLIDNGVLIEDTIVPDTPTHKDIRFEQLRYMGFPMLKKLEYHVKTSGVKVSLTSQLRHTIYGRD